MAKDKPRPEVKKAIEAMKGRYPATPDRLIPLLQFIQAELGYLPAEGMAAIAEYLKAPPSHVYGVATFYTQFRFKPLGKNRFTVCRGTACHVRGSAKLVEDLERELGIKAGDTSADMMFSLQTVACFGSCALAPVILVNDKVYGKVTSKSVKEIIARIKTGTTADAPTPAPAAKPAEKIKPAPAPKPPALKPSAPKKSATRPAPVPRTKSAAKKAAKPKAKAAAGRKSPGKAAPKSGARRGAAQKKSAAAGKTKRK